MQRATVGGVHLILVVVERVYQVTIEVVLVQRVAVMSASVCRVGQGRSAQETRGRGHAALFETRACLRGATAAATRATAGAATATATTTTTVTTVHAERLQAELVTQMVAPGCGNICGVAGRLVAVTLGAKERGSVAFGAATCSRRRGRLDEES